MFPEAFVEKHLAASPFSGVVYDPFCGRGTTPFTALLRERHAAGSDVNPVAVCISGAKCDPPRENEVIARLHQLEEQMVEAEPQDEPLDMREFFQLCFHRDTLAAVLFLRDTLKWRTDTVDRFIAAVALGVLHGESHRTPNCLSNRMPRTISTKPEYSVRWWKERNLLPEARDAFEILRRVTRYRFYSVPPGNRGRIVEVDARLASRELQALSGCVTDVITSPPYLDTTNYLEDQWLRLWFLGGDAVSTHKRADSRHVNEEAYWSFLEEAWCGVAGLLADQAQIVIRIGERRRDKDQLRRKLTDSLIAGLSRSVSVVGEGISSKVPRSQASAFRGSKPSPITEHDYVFRVV